ncbi:MAG: YD repeat-containing protein [Gammaproteobacteria bacterium]|jgi:YD repeat-containing protein
MGVNRMGANGMLGGAVRVAMLALLGVTNAPAGTVGYQYDANGRLLEVNVLGAGSGSSNAAYTYSTGAAGRIGRVVRSAAGGQLVVSAVSIGADEAPVGNVVRFDVRLTNVGQGTALDVRLKFAFDTSVQIVKMRSTVGRCEVPVLTCTLTGLSAGAESVTSVYVAPRAHGRFDIDVAAYSVAEPVPTASGVATAGVSVVPSVDSSDSDADGMPNWWELAQGFDPMFAPDAAQDADFDGVSNGQEYALDTNPHVSPAILAAALNNLFSLERSASGLAPALIGIGQWLLSGKASGADPQGAP